MKEKIYNSVPIFIQNVLISFYGYKLKIERYGSFYKREIEKLRKRNDKNFDYYTYQLNQLNTFLEYAKKNSEYYAQILSDIELPLKNIDELKKIPILEKEDIRRNIDKIITVPKSQAIKSYTGGTTGKSLTVYYTKKNFQERMAYLDYFKEQHGVKKGMKRASFTGKNLVPIKQTKKIFWRYNAALKQLLFSSFHCTEENIPYYIDKLNEFKPKSLDGFPSVILKIAKYALKNNIKFQFQPIAIFPTAETLLDADREIIEKAFKCKVRNQYASSEGAPFITECTHGSLHLNIETGVFEKVNKNSNISEFYVTSFTTYGTPLIRYKIGDSLEFTDEKCTCGVNTPIVKRILGRSTDYLYSKERGTISSANMSNVVKTLPYSIIGIQFIQTEIDKIIINIVADPKLYREEHTDIIKKELHYRLGENMNFQINFVNELKQEKSGKTRFIINKLDLDTMER